MVCRCFQLSEAATQSASVFTAAAYRCTRHQLRITLAIGYRLTSLPKRFGMSVHVTLSWRRRRSLAVIFVNFTQGAYETISELKKKKTGRM